jgi:hypothetical protein
MIEAIGGGPTTEALQQTGRLFRIPQRPPCVGYFVAMPATWR